MPKYTKATGSNPKPYILFKKGDGRYDLKDRKTSAVVGTLNGADKKWDLKLFGEQFPIMSKLKALGVVRGVFAARVMVQNAFKAA